MTELFHRVVARCRRHRVSSLSTSAAILLVAARAWADAGGGGAATGDEGWDWFVGKLLAIGGNWEWFLGTAVAVGTVGAAGLGVRATLKTLRHKQYETAANMLWSIDNRSGGWGYVARTAAIASLAKLAKDHPKDYDEPVMRAFEATLSFPPRYGKNAEKQGQVDFTSPETVAIVQTINARARKQRKAYRISLPPDRPFRVTKKGNVERNPDYKDPCAN